MGDDKIDIKFSSGSTSVQFNQKNQNEGFNCIFVRFRNGDRSVCRRGRRGSAMGARFGGSARFGCAQRQDARSRSTSVTPTSRPATPASRSTSQPDPLENLTSFGAFGSPRGRSSSRISVNYWRAVVHSRVVHAGACWLINFWWLWICFYFRLRTPIDVKRLK